MGVGAVFISTLALHRLPTPNDPPVTQQDHLATMIQPIVSFVVLSSIIIRKSFIILVVRVTYERTTLHIDGLSIPFFTFGVNLSRTISRSTTLNSTRVYPEWMLGIRRNPTLPRPPDSENPTLASESIKEYNQSQRGGPYAFDGVEPQPAAAAPTGFNRSEVQLGPPELVVATDDSIEEVMVSVDSVDPRLPKAVHFPDP